MSPADRDYAAEQVAKRVSATDTSDTYYRAMQENLSSLEASYMQAVTEREYWTARENDIDSVLRAQREAFNMLPQNQGSIATSPRSTAR